MRPFFMKVLYLNPTSCLGGQPGASCYRFWSGSVRAADPSAKLHLLLPGEGPLARHAEAVGARVGLVPMPPALAALGDSRAGPGTGLGKLTALLQRARGQQRRRPGITSRGWAGRCAGWRPDLIHSNGLQDSPPRPPGPGRAPPVLWHMHDFVSASGRPAVGRLLRLARHGRGGGRGRVGGRGPRPGAMRPGTAGSRWVRRGRYGPVLPAPRDASWLDAAAGVPPAAEGTVRIGLITSCWRWKGHDIFLRAAALTKVGCAQAHALYVGRRPRSTTRTGRQFSETELHGLVRRLGLEDCVGFIGLGGTRWRRSAVSTSSSTPARGRSRSGLRLWKRWRAARRSWRPRPGGRRSCAGTAATRWASRRATPRPLPPP